MARTKQTPRNPNVDRPTTTMGSGIQPERRIPSKPTTKNIPRKGGKQLILTSISSWIVSIKRN